MRLRPRRTIKEAVFLCKKRLRALSSLARPMNCPNACIILIIQRICENNTVNSKNAIDSIILHALFDTVNSKNAVDSIRLKALFDTVNGQMSVDSIFLGRF